MTCIAGIVKGNTVWIGGDSAGTSGNGDQRVIADKKVFVINDVAFGVCGSPKVMNVLKHVIVLPKQAKKTNDESFVISELIPTLKACFEQNGCSEGEEFNGALLLGYRGALYRVEGNFQVITSAYGFDSVGAGSDIAMGSLHSTTNVRDSKSRIMKALEASAINNATVRPPFNIVSVKR